MTATATHHTPVRSPAGSRPRASGSLRRHVPTSFTEAWHRSTYAVIALPLNLASIVLTLCGRSVRAEHLQRTAAHRFLGAPAIGPRPASAGRVLLYSVLSVPLGMPTLILVGYGYGNAIRNLTYPVWYGDSDYHQAWGGPTMAGVWTVHAIGGLAFLTVCLCLVKILTNAQAALVPRNR
jgi:hypothetical protein